MWTIEKTEEGQDLVWSQPETGIGASALKGTANMQNVNIATEPGVAFAAFARTNQAQTAISDGSLTPDGATLFDAPTELLSGSWIKVTASTVTSISAATNPSTISLNYLMVGGGGGGGGAGPSTNDTGGGGGGAGELVDTTASFSVGSYTVTIGTGGAGGGTSGTKGTEGTDTSISTIDTAVGGGGGGGTTAALDDGTAGGSGGGGGGDQGAPSSGTGATGTAGNDGGDGFTGGDGGGGGGASANGGTGSGTGDGDGGAGTASSISGVSTNYAGGGGGGGGNAAGDGGTGGGGAGGNDDNGTAGTANTGGGGGGGGNNGGGSTKSGGAGGSGIVIIAYATGTAYCIGGEITQTATTTVHTFKDSGVFEVVWINPGGLYYVSYKDDSDQIKLSSLYDPYGADVVTHGTTGSITFDTLTTVGQPIAKATEKYKTSTGEEYRYYILDANSYVWVYDTLVYETTLTDNNVGVTWMLADPTDYTNEPLKGMSVLNGWLMLLSSSRVLCKPTVTLGTGAYFMNKGWLTNPYPNHPNFAYVGSQGTMYYTDGNYIGEVYPTNSLITSIANLQSYASYTASTSVGTIATLIGGSIPAPINDSRVPVVFFNSIGGTLPTAVSGNVVYYLEYDLPANTFTVYDALTGGSTVDVETGATGTQYFNTFWPVGTDAGHGGTNPTLQYTSQRVNLPFYETAQRMVEIDNTIMIGCKGNVVYPWNQVDATPSNVITLPEGDVKAMLNVNNMAYIFAGNKGNIYITNSVVASLVLKIPDYTAGVPGTPNSYIEPTFTWGDAIFNRGRVYASILDQTATKAGNCGGVWSFIPSENIDQNQNVGTALRLEAQNSYADYDGYAPILINVIEQTGGSPKYWAAWQDSYSAATSTFGIDYSTENPVTEYVVETDLAPTGTFLAKKTYEQLEYKLAVPLADGDSVQLYWRIDPTSTWTSAGTVHSETANPISGWYDINFEKTQWVQIRAVVTTGGTTASTFVPLKEIRLR